MKRDTFLLLPCSAVYCSIEVLCPTCNEVRRYFLHDVKATVCRQVGSCNHSLQALHSSFLPPFSSLLPSSPPPLTSLCRTRGTRALSCTCARLSLHARTAETVSSSLTNFHHQTCDKSYASLSHCLFLSLSQIGRASCRERV